jgi:hypothetical protein
MSWPPSATASSPRSNTGTCAMSSGRTACRDPGARCAVIDGKAAYRDAYYEEYQLAIELDGKQAHPDEERWRDRHRDNQAGAQGILTVRYGWRDIYGHPCQTALVQARILRRRGWRGTPRPCSATCPVGREPATREAVTGEAATREPSRLASAPRPGGSICRVYADRVNQCGRLRV